jgi:hypothetical protein
VSLSTGLATAFDNVNGVVNKVLVDGSSAYIGGRFTQVGATLACSSPRSIRRRRVAAWYPAGGSRLCRKLASTESSISAATF